MFSKSILGRQAFPLHIGNYPNVEWVFGRFRALVNDRFFTDGDLWDRKQQTVITLHLKRKRKAKKFNLKKHPETQRQSYLLLIEALLYAKPFKPFPPPLGADIAIPI